MSVNAAAVYTASTVAITESVVVVVVVVVSGIIIISSSSSSIRVEEFKYLGTTLTNQNSIQKEIKSRLKLGNVCYHSVKNLLSSSLLSKNLKIKIILPVVLYGCETWSRTLREEHRLRVFENRVLRRIFGAKSDGVTGEWRKLHNEELQ